MNKILEKSIKNCIKTRFIHPFETIYACCTQRLRKRGKGYQRLTRWTISVILKYDQDWSLRPNCALIGLLCRRDGKTVLGRALIPRRDHKRKTHDDRQFQVVVFSSALLFSGAEFQPWKQDSSERNCKGAAAFIDRMGCSSVRTPKPLSGILLGADVKWVVLNEYNDSRFHVLFAHDTWFLSFLDHLE